MTRDEILGAILHATGAPTTGPVAEITPAIADAIDVLANPPAPEEAKRATRVVKADETR